MLRPRVLLITLVLLFLASSPIQTHASLLPARSQEILTWKTFAPDSRATTLQNHDARQDEYLTTIYPTTGERVLSVRIHDLNQDGLQDIGIVTWERRLRLFLQNPQCHGLQEKYDLPIDTFPGDLDIADLNGDGLVDIVVDGDDRIQIVYQSAQGFKYSETNYPLPKSAGQVKIADVTWDGRPDIVTLAEHIIVFVQQTDGTFQALHLNNPVIQDDYPRDFVVADFNSDEHLDIALLTSGRTPENILIYKYDPASDNFDPGIAVNTGSFFAVYMAAGDVSGDGLDDLILLEYLSPFRIRIYEQTVGGGLIDPPVEFQTYWNPIAPQIHDMNQDGRKDLVMFNSGYGSFTIHYQKPEGGLGEQNVFVVGTMVQPLFHAFSDIGDVTGDGKPDLAYLSINDGLVVISKEAPYCPPPVSYPARPPIFQIAVSPYMEVNDMTSGDVDGDGLDDFMTFRTECPDVNQMACIQMIRQLPGGNFALWTQISLGTPYPIFRGLSSGDLNSDGRLDITFTGYVGDKPLYILLQNPDGSFPLPVARTDIPKPGQTYIADWNSDGLNDLAVLGEDGIYILAQQTDGSLGSPTQHAEGEFYSTTLSTLTDWNRDGRVDIAGYATFGDFTQQNGPVRVLLQQPDGSFHLLPPRSYRAYSGFAAGDLNGDSRPDLANSNSGMPPESRVGVFYQQPDGSIGDRVQFSPPNFNVNGPIAIADFNFDGLKDMMVLCTGYFTVFPQNYLHELGQYYNYLFGAYNWYDMNPIAGIDTDHDGNIDVFGVATHDWYFYLLKAVPTDDIYLPIIRK